MATEVFRVRYYECDMQQVVHNAVYLAWCDDAGDRLFRSVGLGAEGEPGWDVMVKAASITWAAPARIGDEISVELGPSRWGRTSFDVTYHGTRDGDPIFEATITYVAVDMDSGTPIEVPATFRDALSAA